MESNRSFPLLRQVVLDTTDGAFHYGKFSDDDGQVVRRRAEVNYVANPAGGAGELVWHNDQNHKPQLK